MWDKQPAPKDHPWRHMKNQAMTPHTSGTTLDAQASIVVSAACVAYLWPARFVIHSG